MVSATVVVGGGAYTCSSVAVHVPGHRLLFRKFRGRVWLWLNSAGLRGLSALAPEHQLRVVMRLQDKSQSHRSFLLRVFRRKGAKTSLLSCDMKDFFPEEGAFTMKPGRPCHLSPKTPESKTLFLPLLLAPRLSAQTLNPKGEVPGFGQANPAATQKLRV